MNVELKIEYSWVALTAGFLWVDTPLVSREDFQYFHKRYPLCNPRL